MARIWIWVADEVALAAHAEQIAEHGGGEGIRDRGALESAMARPRNLAAYRDPDAASLAAAYAYGIARNHPFVDGNKRVGHAAMETFVVLNGAEIDACLDEQERVMLDLAAGRVDRGQLADWLRQHLKPLE